MSNTIAGEIVGEYVGNITWKRISAGRYHGSGPKGAVWIERNDRTGFWYVTWPVDIRGHWNERPNRSHFATLTKAKDETIQFLLSYRPRKGRA